MKLSDFCRCYTNAADDNLVKDMLEWFESDDEAQTVTANRDTRKDLQKWVPVGTTLYNRIEQSQEKTLDLYLDEFPYVYKGSKQLVSEETKIQRTDTHKWVGFITFTQRYHTIKTFVEFLYGHYT